MVSIFSLYDDDDDDMIHYESTLTSLYILITIKNNKLSSTNHLKFNNRKDPAPGLNLRLKLFKSLSNLLSKVATE